MECPAEWTAIGHHDLDRPAPLAGAGHTALCIKVLAGIVSQETVPPAARVSSAGFLLDRRAPQPLTPERTATTAASPSNKLSMATRSDIDQPSGGWARSKEAVKASSRNERLGR